MIEVPFKKLRLGHASHIGTEFARQPVDVGTPNLQPVDGLAKVVAALFGGALFEDDAHAGKVAVGAVAHAVEDLQRQGQTRRVLGGRVLRRGQQCRAADLGLRGDVADDFGPAVLQTRPRVEADKITGVLVEDEVSLGQLPRHEAHAVFANGGERLADAHHVIDTGFQEPSAHSFAALFLDAEADAHVLLGLFLVELVRFVDGGAPLVEDVDDEGGPVGLHQRSVIFNDLNTRLARHLRYGSRADEHLVDARLKEDTSAGAGRGHPLAVPEDPIARLVVLGHAHGGHEQQAFAPWYQHGIAGHLQTSRRRRPRAFVGVDGKSPRQRSASQERGERRQNTARQHITDPPGSVFPE